MKFGQLIEYNLKKNFLEKSYPKCRGKILQNRFLKRKKLSTFLDQE